MKTRTALPACTLVAIAVSAIAAAGAPADAAPVNLAQGRLAKADSLKYPANGPATVVDGVVSDASRYIGGAGKAPHWLEVDLGAPAELGSAHLYSGYGTQSTVSDFELQYWTGSAWAPIPGTQRRNNGQTELALPFGKPVTTSKVRLWATANHQDILRVKELALFAPQPDGGPALGAGVKRSDEGAAEQAVPVKTAFDAHPVMVNQSGYNLDGPKRFTAPLAKGEADFTIAAAGSDAVLYRGKVRDGLGDFSDFRPEKTDADYVITVTGGELKPGVSDPFRVAPYWMERACLEMAVRFMQDARSVVGTHPSAYGGSPWRDGTYYAFETPSLIMLYLADPAYFERLPTEMDWGADRRKVTAPDFQLVKSNGDTGALEAARKYYAELDAPGTAAPDLAQLIHWGIGYYLCKPESTDPTEGKARIHAQTVEQFAFFLHGLPVYGKHFSAPFVKRATAFAREQWEPAGLFGVITNIGDFKGRECPGHSILPNLLMHETAAAQGWPEAGRYLDAAAAQAEWVVREVDFKVPLTTKGQRMSEHKLMPGLAALLERHPDRASAGLREKIRQWADIAIARSANLWDFRKYDDGDNWTLPRFTPGSHGGAGWNEPGNLAGFEALACAAAPFLEAAPAARLRQIGVAQIDHLFGRNPLGAASAYYGPKYFMGVERGWPKDFGKDSCARLYLARGALNSSAATEHFPFNPGGPFRHCEGWVNFNAAFNVSLAYLCREDTQLSFGGAVKPGTAVSVLLRGPIGFDPAQKLQATIELASSGGDRETVTVAAAATGSFELRGSLPTAAGAAKPGDGTLQVKAGERVTATYGFGFLGRTVSAEVP